MVAQDVADHQLARRLLRGGDGRARRLDGQCQRLLDEYMGTGLHRLDRQFDVAIGIGVDRHHVGFQSEAGFETGDVFVMGQLFRQFDFAAVEQGNHFEGRVGVIGQRMRLAHLTEAGDEDPERAD
jgi:hypothetical protein